jgi:plasmid stabilization system protein ParE
MTGPFRVRFHPRVKDDVEAIARLVAQYSGAAAARRRLAEIEAAVRSLEDTPHRGSLRHDIAPGLRAIPAGRRAVIVFNVDDDAREVRVIVVGYGGSDWIGRVAERR